VTVSVKPTLVVAAANTQRLPFKAQPSSTFTSISQLSSAKNQKSPASAVDAGATWKKLTEGMPKGDIGRIGIAVSPVAPDTVYATVESLAKDSGFYRTTDAGAHWEKRGGYLSTSPQYYQEIFADPLNVDRVYAMDTFLQVTNDGGATFSRLGESDKHVDNHAFWIDPTNHDHLINGNDGGVYESFDHAKTWNFKGNLPIAQFYRVTVDDSRPFYFVYGGTQDNNSVGGPSRTLNQGGIANSDWFVTVAGDGFVTRVDPQDPMTVYAESQNGGLARFDRRTGETVDIQPQPSDQDAALRFNWDSPLLISPHSRTRLYFGAQKIFRSEDRGDTWAAVSPDLTRQIDRNKLKVMGRVWSVDTVAKNASTSFYGNLVSLSESPLVEGVLYAGSDDGLISISENSGGDWRKVDNVAICFVNSFMNPANEQRMRDILLEELPGVTISLSSDIMPEIFEHERFSTTVANAVLRPLVGRGLREGPDAGDPVLGLRSHRHDLIQ